MQTLFLATMPTRMGYQDLSELQLGPQIISDTGHPVKAFRGPRGVSRVDSSGRRRRARQESSLSCFIRYVRNRSTSVAMGHTLTVYKVTQRSSHGGTKGRRGGDIITRFRGLARW